MDELKNVYDAIYSRFFFKNPNGGPLGAPDETDE
jgi:hypothetical protein